MWRDDIAGSRAHVRGLARVGLLTDAERDAMLDALDPVATELASGTFVFVETDEDIHTAVERRVTELAGPAGGKLHTGRSRNDQVATDLRLWCKRELLDVARGVLALQEVLLPRAVDADDAYLPGYTHLQRAQPVLLAHHLLAHGWASARDVDRLLDDRAGSTCHPSAQVRSPGRRCRSTPSAPPPTSASPGCSTTRSTRSRDRDFVAEAVFDLALIGIHLSRIGEEWVLWTSAEFGFARLDDTYATGSSMLPQKKNPDIAELARGKSGRLIGNLTGLLATLKGLPLAYNRDLQEDKEPLFDSVEQVTLALAAITGMIATATFVTDACRPPPTRRPWPPPTSRSTSCGRHAVPRRPRRGRRARATPPRRRGTLRRPRRRPPRFGPEAAALVAPGVGVTMRTSRGAAGPEALPVQLDGYRAMLARDQERLGLIDRSWFAGPRRRWRRTCSAPCSLSNAHGTGCRGDHRNRGVHGG